MILIIFFVTLLAAVLIGMPIGFALMFSGTALMIYLGEFSSIIISSNLFSGADSFALMAIPFFILTGEFMNRGGITEKIVNFANALVGHIKGGLGYVSILAILLFAAMIGSAVASTAALGGILIPMMVRAGYNRTKSTSLVAAGNILSPIMPPSVPLILFGVTAGVSVTNLFLGGIIPAIYLTAILCITWFFVTKNDDLPTADRPQFKNIRNALFEGVWALLLPVIILVGLQSGFFTPTEAGVVAAVYAFIIGLFIYRELSIKITLEALISTAKSSAVIMFLAAAANIASWMLTVGNVQQLVTNVLEPLIERPTILMFVIAVITIIIGTSMDVTPIILILTPVLAPVVEAAGIDLVYFGVVFVLVAMFGLLTPPVGNVLNVASKAGGISMGQMIKGVMPFLLAELALLILLILFPALIEVPLSYIGV